MQIPPSDIHALPRSTAQTKSVWTDLSKLGGPQGRDDCQFGWHRWAGELFRGCSILDVGAGLGLSRTRLEAGANVVFLQDPAPDMPVETHDDLATFPSRSFDVVTAFDVIEHVADDAPFLANLCRIARRAVVITTPNFNISHAANPYHVREYSPPEFLTLLSGSASRILYAGNSNGTERVNLSTEEFETHALPHHAVILAVSVPDSNASIDGLPSDRTSMSA